jgi:hypothetical protein
VLALADRVEEAVDEARAKGGKQELVASRVERAIRRILTTERERKAAARELAERRRRPRHVVHEWTFGPNGEVLEMRAALREGEREGI